MAVDLTWLETNALHTTLSPKEKKALLPLTELTFAKGDTIIKQGDEGGSLYIIKSGEASVQDYNRYEGRLSFVTLKEGDLIGELSFLNGRRAAADVKADADCVLYKLSKSDMSRLMKNEQGLAFTIMNTIVNHEAKLLGNMRRELVPMLRNFKDKADKLPLTIKLVPVIFTLLYIGGFIYISFKDFSY